MLWVHVWQGEGQLGQAASQAVAGAEVERHVQLSCGEHTDYGLLTLVNQEPHIPALQVLQCSSKQLRKRVVAHYDEVLTSSCPQLP